MPNIIFSFKNIDGFSALSGGVIQITKNFKNLGEMTGDKDCDFIFSALIKRQRIEIFIYRFKTIREIYLNHQ